MGSQAPKTFITFGRGWHTVGQFGPSCRGQIRSILTFVVFSFSCRNTLYIFLQMFSEKSSQSSPACCGFGQLSGLIKFQEILTDLQTAPKGCLAHPKRMSVVQNSPKFFTFSWPLGGGGGVSPSSQPDRFFPVFFYLFPYILKLYN